MNKLDAETTWDTLNEYIELIESLPDPWGRRGFFSFRTGRWLGFRYSIVDFYLEKDAKSWVASQVANSYTEKSRKENTITAINQFIEWYNKATVQDV